MSNSRIHRKGQNRDVAVAKIYSDSDVLNALENKRAVAGDLIGFTVNASPRTKNVTATETTPRGKSRAVRKRKRKAQRTARRANR